MLLKALYVLIIHLTITTGDLHYITLHYTVLKAADEGGHQSPEASHCYPG